MATWIIKGCVHTTLWKFKVKLPLLLAIFLITTNALGGTSGSAFTYQGQLNQAGAPANGEFDFQFVLFDSDDFVLGTQLQDPVTIQNHPVDSGLFSVEIDFGADAFGVVDTWLEVRIRVGDSNGPFTTLAPRKRITPVPLALHAINVEAGAIGSEQLASGSVGTSQIEDASIVSSDVNQSQIQLRIGQICAAGSAIRGINSDGSVICESDSDTTYDAGFGLGLVSETLSVDTIVIQRRVTGTCPPEQFMVGINVDGSVQCTALPVNCSIELICPTPITGKSCISGRLSDAQNAAPIEAIVSPESSCSGDAEGGPCDLTLEIHDAVSFASNPATSTPLSFGELLVDGCGRFRFSDMTPSGTGFVTLTVGDSRVFYELSAHTTPLVANDTVEQFNALAVRISTVQIWTDTAGEPFGADTFADRGVLFSTFTKDGNPVSAVTILRSGAPQANADYYFSDLDSNTRTTVSPGQNNSGANGAALMVDSSLVNHSGTGGETESCVWSNELAGTFAGVVSVAAFTCD